MIELIVAVAIATLVSLMVLPGIHYITKAQIYLKESAELEETNKELSNIIPLYIGHAVNVDWTSSAINNIDGGRGRMRIFNSSMTASVAPPVAVGVYLREVGDPGASNARGDIRATALYFRNPSPTTPGELLISTSGFGVGTTTLSSDQSAHRFENIVEFSLRPGGNSTINEPVRVVEARIVIRKFSLNNQGGDFWCPQFNIDNGSPGCGGANLRNFRDIVHTLYLPVVNNAIDTTDYINTAGDLRKETLYGNLYFFKQTTVGE